MADLQVVEICAGAGGQALGLELAGFEHALAVELDENAASTLRANRDWKVAVGDVADTEVWRPTDFAGIDLLAGGVPCPPFSIAGKQLGATDERDLFAWAVELAAVIRPRALLLENVRGLAMPRFSAYRQHVKDRLDDLGYRSEWRLLQASDYGVPQLRPRFVLVAIQRDETGVFHWPEAIPSTETVGSTLLDLMAADGWSGANAWARRANTIAPTIVGGSKKHGGADLGPTRAKRAWHELGVDGLGIADAPPTSAHSSDFMPKLTCEMVQRLQGWQRGSEYEWHFTGRKTSRYRQIGNAFPPPVAFAVGTAVHAALDGKSSSVRLTSDEGVMHDSIYRAMRSLGRFATVEEIAATAGEPRDGATIEKRIGRLSHDFIVEHVDTTRGKAYRLVSFKGFIGQEDHERYSRFDELRSKIS